MRKIRMGMIGGGPGAFIGSVHRAAAAMDGLIELVCGSFSSDPAKSKQMGEELTLSSERVYANFEEMIRGEAALPAGIRMDFVSIVTPNHLFAPAPLLPLSWDSQHKYGLSRSTCLFFLQQFLVPLPPPG